MSQAGEVVGYDLLPPVSAWYFRQITARNPTGETKISWTGGCELGTAAKRRILLNPGEYILETRGVPFLSDEGGRLVLSMTCDSGTSATSRLATSNPGGLAVDPMTGVVSGSPLRVGTSYDMRLVAKDSSGARAEIQRWVFDVTDPAFRTRGAFRPLDNRSKYLVDQTHTILGPEAHRRMVFVDPAKGRYSGIVYHLEVNRSATQQISTNSASCVFAATSAETGTAFFRINCTGQYVAALHARDVGGADVTVYEGWSFEVKPADTESSANGPNGKDCAVALTRLDPFSYVPRDHRKR